MDTSVPRTVSDLSSVVEALWPNPTGNIQLVAAEIPAAVIAYVAWLEKTETKYTCTCSWTVHPDDVLKPEGKRRIHRGEPDLNCKVHTREGFLLGFFTFMNNRPDTPTAELDSSDRFSNLTPMIEERIAIAEHVRMTPIAWLSRMPGRPHIVDCDGWTDAEWSVQLPLTYEEFSKRLSMCTLTTTPPMVKCPPQCGCRSHGH